MRFVILGCVACVETPRRNVTDTDMMVTSLSTVPYVGFKMDNVATLIDLIGC